MQLLVYTWTRPSADLNIDICKHKSVWKKTYTHKHKLFLLSAQLYHRLTASSPTQQCLFKSMRLFFSPLVSPLVSHCENRQRSRYNGTSVTLFSHKLSSLLTAFFLPLQASLVLMLHSMFCHLTQKPLNKSCLANSLNQTTSSCCILHS